MFIRILPAPKSWLMLPKRLAIADMAKNHGEQRLVSTGYGASGFGKKLNKKRTCPFWLHFMQPCRL